MDDKEKRLDILFWQCYSIKNLQTGVKDMFRKSNQLFISIMRVYQIFHTAVRE